MNPDAGNYWYMCLPIGCEVIEVEEVVVRNISGLWEAIHDFMYLYVV